MKKEVAIGIVAVIIVVIAVILIITFSKKEQLIGGCAGVSLEYLQECCDNWAAENEIAVKECEGEWRVESGRCVWKCYVLDIPLPS